MDRRSLLKRAGVVGVMSGGSHLLAQRIARLALGASVSVPVHTVWLVTKCHLDVGFTMTQQKVLQRYFEVYFPQAMQLASRLRKAGGDRYTWTTGAWLLYEYLEQADAAQRKAAEQAIAAHDLAWHALPFNWQTEMIDRSMVDGAMGFSRRLDQRFGVSTTSGKMTDVPGHSRGLVAPLAQAGVRLLDIGVNAASTPPDVPDLFLWREPGGQALAVMYHRHNYGSLLEIPGTGVAVDVEVRNDNSGPHTPEEVAAIYAKLRQAYPGAVIKAGTLNDVAAVVDSIRPNLPVVTGEIGDTWIYGCASDPKKVAAYRSLARLREQWIGQGVLRTGDDADCALLSRLLLAAEHTWGTDTKTYLDDDHYRPADLDAVLAQPGYVVMQTSWEEKRQNTLDAVARLPAPLKTQAEAGIRDCEAQRPDTARMRRHDAAAAIETAHFSLRFDPATGAMTHCRNKQTGVDWATADHPLALFTYQTLSSAEYEIYLKQYLAVETEWGPKDFGKPGIQAFQPTARDWHPQVTGCFVSEDGADCRVVLELAIKDPEVEATGDVAWPTQMYADLHLPAAAPHMELRFTTLGKRANRLPEAMWLTFHPAGVDAATWEVEKVNQTVRAVDVVRGGGRAMHAVSGAVRCEHTKGHRFAVETLDAPVVAFGARSPLNFSLDQPDLSEGAHVCLFNNGWGTNYPQWSGGDWLYRLRISASSPPPPSSQ